MVYQARPKANPGTRTDSGLGGTAQVHLVVSLSVGRIFSRLPRSAGTRSRPRRGGTMPLSDHEQRMLDQIESELSTEDPKFASSVRGGSLRAPSARRRAPGRSTLRDRRGDAGIRCGFQGHHDRKLPDPHGRWARQVGLRVGRAAPASGETLPRLIYRAHGRSLPTPLRSVGSSSEFSADAGPEVRPFTVSYRSENWDSVAGRSVCRHLAAPKCVSALHKRRGGNAIGDRA
jgi:hypothetical protein